MKRGVLGLLLGSVLVLGSCMDSYDGLKLAKFKDLKRSWTAEWHLKYDHRDRLTEFGHTPIEYGVGKVQIGKMDWDYRGEQLLSATYFFSWGKVSRCEAHCLWVTDSTEVEVRKEVSYRTCGDTIKTEATYWSVPDGHPLRQVYTQYVYNQEGSLTEVISRYEDAERGHSVCHSYYSYVNNVSYRSNLDMKAFFLDAEGPDGFFFLLLDMDRKHKAQKLPDRIIHCMDHGKAKYMADAMFRTQGDYIDRAEVVSDDMKLKARMEFGYYPEK